MSEIPDWEYNRLSRDQLLITLQNQKTKIMELERELDQLKIARGEIERLNEYEERIRVLERSHSREDGES